MSDSRIDYSVLQNLTTVRGGRDGETAGEGEGWGEGRSKGRAKGRAKDRRRPWHERARLRWALARTAWATAIVTVLALGPFFLLIRGGVLAYREWGLGTWPSLLLAVIATALLLGLYALVVSRWLGAGARMTKVFTRAAMGVGIVYVVYGLVFIASENVKSDEVQAGYAAVHPMLRIAASSLILIDPVAVLTDAARTPEDYWLMGLPPNEASLHFVQETGYVHAFDLRTVGRPEWRNRLVELGFWALGFHSLRHVGTADHLHVSLRLPD